MTNEISIFNFNENQVRTQLIHGEPWFCLSDCCGALEIKSSKDVVRQLPHKGAVLTRLLTKGGIQETYFINEPNLYRLVFRSRKPQAQAFADWVYSEVLPTIRKTGSYSIAPGVDMKALGGLVKRCCRASIKEYWVDFLSGQPETYKALQETIGFMLKQCVREELEARDSIRAQNADYKNRMQQIQRWANGAE